MPITWAIAAILQSPSLRPVGPIPTVALGTWASAVLLAPLALVQLPQGQHWTLASALAFAYLVLFGTSFGMVVSLWLYRKLRPTTITLIQVLVPAEAILIGTLWLGEQVTWRMLGGAALVVAAVALNAIAGGGTPPVEEQIAAVPAAAEGWGEQRRGRRRSSGSPIPGGCVFSTRSPSERTLPSGLLSGPASNRATPSENSRRSRSRVWWSGARARAGPCTSHATGIWWSSSTSRWRTGGRVLPSGTPASFGGGSASPCAVGARDNHGVSRPDLRRLRRPA